MKRQFKETVARKNPFLTRKSLEWDPTRIGGPVSAEKRGATAREEEKKRRRITTYTATDYETR